MVSEPGNKTEINDADVKKKNSAHLGIASETNASTRFSSACSPIVACPCIYSSIVCKELLDFHQKPAIQAT